MFQNQYQKIIDMCSDNDWHCQIEFWNLYIRSPHKRRAEIECKGKYKFLWRECGHGRPNQRDYKMIENPNYVPPPVLSREEEERRILSAALL